MAQRCQITGKRASTGNNVSHSQRKTKRRFKPNLFKKKVVDPATGRVKRMLVSASALRTLRKKMK